jgi:hypothetical protein
MQLQALIQVAQPAAQALVLQAAIVQQWNWPHIPVVIHSYVVVAAAQVPWARLAVG